MEFCYSLLQRMWPVDISDALNCDDMLAVNTDQRKQTSVHGEMLYPPLLRLLVCHLQHNSTSTASSFATSQLRSLEIRLRADIVE